jgi:GT2 family glycosyltransferase
VPVDVSVVVPTAGHEARLAFLLDALAEQTFPPERFEVIVVRDAREREPFTTPPLGPPVRFLAAAARGGPTPLRNAGWRAARGELVAFTDDDCRPRAHWLERLWGAAEQNTFLQGRTEPDPDERHLLRLLARSRTVIGASPWYPACNVAYPRELLERVGGFDEDFRFDGEDTDLALRALAAGAECRYVDDALVWHAVLSRTAIAAARESMAKSSFPLLFAKHPSYREHLYLRVFRNHIHAAVCLGLAGAIAARRLPALGAVAIAPYLAERVARNLTPGRRNARALARLAAHLPARAAVDVVDVAATAASAASHRVLVL